MPTRLGVVVAVAVMVSTATTAPLAHADEPAVPQCVVSIIAPNEAVAATRKATTSWNEALSDEGVGYRLRVTQGDVRLRRGRVTIDRKDGFGIKTLEGEKFTKIRTLLEHGPTTIGIAGGGLNGVVIQKGLPRRKLVGLIRHEIGHMLGARHTYSTGWAMAAAIEDTSPAISGRTRQGLRLNADDIMSQYCHSDVE